ncbi:MAG: hypothetical protein AAF666_11750 [Pseudomonadota bacterium]
MASDRTSDPGLRVHRNLNHRIDRFQVLGDRNSGTNFLSTLIERNFPELQPTRELGWKHGFLDRRMIAAPGLLTFVVYRHPLRWIESVHRAPVEVSQAMTALDFHDFLRAEWQPAWVREDGTEEPIQGDMYPHTTTRFENICRMRSVKIAYLEEMAGMPGQIVFSRFEAVNRAPRAAMVALAATLGMPGIRGFTPVREYEGAQTKAYAPLPAQPVSPDDLAFIRAGLDLEQEARLGFDLDNPPARDGLRWTDPRHLRGLLRL